MIAGGMGRSRVSKVPIEGREDRHTGYYDTDELFRQV